MIEMSNQAKQETIAGFDWFIGGFIPQVPSILHSEVV